MLILNPLKNRQEILQENLSAYVGINTGGKFATGINNTSETSGKICRRCRWYRRSTLSCKYLREFLKKFETALLVYSRAWGKLIHEKNQMQKISWHCPFKGTVSRDFRLLVFFMNQCPPIPWVYHEGRFEFFKKFAVYGIAESRIFHRTPAGYTADKKTRRKRTGGC